MKQIGLAKSHFIAKHQRSPWNLNSISQVFPHQEWPLLERELHDKRLTYFDYLLVQRLLREFPEAEEAVAFFLCHLIMAARNGHLCIKVADDQLFPTVFQLWNNEINQHLNGEKADLFTQLIQQGSKEIPSSLVTKIKFFSSTFYPATPLCQTEHFFYLQKHWIFESLFLHHFNQHIQIPPSIQIDLNQVERDLEEMQLANKLNAEQANAIVAACKQSVTLITGGPGTGKSYTAGKLIHILRNNLLSYDLNNFEIALAAPTGKAAANLQKSLEKVSFDFPKIQAKTLHSLLNVNRSQVQTSGPGLIADLVVVDECSMIDIQVMSKLFESLKAGSRIIMLGDPQQLPSVGAGSVFVDLHHLSHLNLPISHVHLKNCLRAELKSIIEFADLIKDGHADQAIAVLNHSTEGVFNLKLSPDQNIAQKELVAYVASLFLSCMNGNQSQEEIFNSFNALRLLSPLRKGLFGVDILNQLIWKTISQKYNKSPWLAIPIMVSANDYQQELFNGDTGLLFRKLPLNMSEKEDYALFNSRTDVSQLRHFSAVSLPAYELAYCLSVHKSQGSEFSHVILVMPEGAESFGREIFYTAVTRTRKRIEIYGTDSTLKKTIFNQENRLSNISSRFNHLWNEK